MDDKKIKFIVAALVTMCVVFIVLMFAFFFVAVFLADGDPKTTGGDKFFYSGAILFFASLFSGFGALIVSDI